MALKSYKAIGVGPDPVADFLKQLTGNPFISAFLSGRELTVTLDGTSSTQYFNHGLGRAFRGVHVTGQTFTGTDLRIAAPQDIIAAGRDPTTVFSIRPSGAAACVVNVWVY